MRFFQQGLQLILQTDFVPRPLIPCACECPPQSLLGVGHKAQNQLLGNQPLHQTFRVPKVFLAPASSADGQCLRQMECSRHFPGTFPILTARFPVPFEGAHSGFQYWAVDSITPSSTRCSMSHSASRCNCSGLLPNQRRSNWYSSSTSTSTTTTASFFLWTSIPAILYAIGFLLAGAESVPQITLSRVSGYRRSHRGGETTRHLFALSRTLRIRQSFGLSLSTVGSISPLRAIVDYGLALRNFHVISRAAGPR